jgi:hypothetical protein
MSFLRKKIFPFKVLHPTSPLSTTTDAQYSLVLLPNNNSPVPSLSLPDSTSVSIHSTPPQYHIPILSSTLPAPPSITKVYTRRKAIDDELVTTQVPPFVPSFLHSMITRAKVYTLSSQPKTLLTTKHLSEHDLDPTSLTQASKYAHWRSAMAKELDALAQNNT